MAQKYSDSTILPDIYVNWSEDLDDAQRRPYKGQVVREGIQNKYREIDHRLDGIEEKLEMGSLDFRFDNMPSGNVIVNGSAPYDFPLYIRSVLVNPDGSEEKYDSNVQLDIIVSLNGKTSTTSLGYVAANKAITVNITPYVTNGSVFSFKASNDTGAQKRSSYYDVIKANISVEFRSETWWAEAFVQGSEWRIPLSITYNIPSVLKATLIDSEGVVRSSETIPSSSLSENYDLFLNHPSLSGGASGLYRLKIEFIATDESLGGLHIEPIEYSVCCVTPGDATNYLIVNNRAEKLKNYSVNRVFDYAMRIGYGNPTIRFEANVGDAIVSDTGEMTAVAGTVSHYALSLDLERETDADFNVGVKGYINGSKILDETYVSSNKDGYAATAGAAYTIRFNGRSNSEANRETFYNVVDGSEVHPTFNGIGWSGADGYYNEALSDGNIRTSFRILAGSSMVLPLKPLMMQPLEGRTFEIAYKLNNVRNFDTPIISCVDASGNGLKVSANEAVLLTPSARQVDDQNVGMDYSEYQHLVVVVRPQPNGVNANVDNFSACEIFLNGCRQRWFSYNRDLNVNSTITIGCEDADIDIYSIRLYNKHLTEAEVENNTCNLLPTEEDKAAFKVRNSVREEGKVDFNRVRTLCNCIVFEVDELPSREWGKGQKTNAAIEIFMLGETGTKRADVTDFTWQGTTSHNYGTNAEFGGLGQNYKWTDNGTKMCAKANWASSMQSHKIALTAAYTDIAVACGVIPSGQRISILQKPMAGFQKKSDGTISFIGIFTVGTDKGDKGTFGFTDKSLYMEGSDNEPLGTNFILPWNVDTVSVDSANEVYSLGGVKAWEDASKKPQFVESKWKPAYNFVYECMQRIKPCESVEAMSGADGSYSMWTPDYELYYYNPVLAQWKTSGINLKAQLVDKEYGLTSAMLEGKSAEQKNELFKEARRKKFKLEAEQYFDRKSFLHHISFIEFFACSDNLSKNTYPYILDATAANAKICWRQDDLDSSLQTENQGKNYKKYCVEIDDNYASYGRDNLMVFNGTNNQFWLLVRDCYAAEIKNYISESFIPSLQYGQAASANVAFSAWCQHYFFDNAQSHFPEALYNETGRLRYGYGHLSSGYQYANIALSQDSGNCFSAEKQWLRLRYIYMTSKYCVGIFAGGSKTDVFTTRPYADPQGIGNTFEITPAIWMYPSVQNGESVIRGERIWQGGELRTWVVTLPATQGDQEQRINGMSYIRSLGALYNAAIRGGVNVNGRMLVSLEMGSRDDIGGIRSRITGLGVGDATSLQELNLANLATLEGVVDLSSCVNLKELYAEGTSVASVPLCDGGPLMILHLPATLTTLELKGKRNLTEFTIAGASELITLSVEDCNDSVVKAALNIISDNYNAS